MFRIFSQICLLFVISFIPIYRLHGQVYNVSRYSTSDGLLQSQVRAIIQDHRRFIWLGTHGGLSSFDGRGFQHNTLENSSIGRFVTCLMEDHRRNIWVGTEQGLGRYDRLNFTYFGEKEGLGRMEILALARDSINRIWVGTDQGLFSYEENKFISHKLSDKQVRVQSIYVDHKGTIWLGCSDGLRYLDNVGRLHQVEGMNQSVQVVWKDTKAQIWLGTDLGAYKSSGQIPEQFTKVGREQVERTIYCFTEDRDGTIWMGSSNGVLLYKGGELNVFMHRDERILYKIRSLLCDLEGNIWLGTDGGGLRKITQGIFRVFNVEDGLSSNIAKSFLEDDKGNFWISTYDQGLNLMRDDNFSPVSTASGLGGNDLSYSYKDSKGTCWFASYTGGLTRYDKNGFRVFGTREGLSSSQIYCIEEEVPGKIWVGTDKGINILDDGTWISTIDERGGLISPIVYALRKDSKGNMWAGTPEGLCLLRDEKWIDLSDSVKNRTVFSIIEDKWNRLWIATLGGLYLYEQEQFYPIRISGAPKSHNVVSLVIENENLLWIGTENGIYRLNIQTFRPDRPYFYDHYTEKDGLPSMECNANAAYLDSKGNLWFGTAEGAILHPSGSFLKQEDISPVIHITSVRSPFSDTLWSAFSRGLDPLSGLPRQLSLPPKENRLTFDFIGISHRSPNQVEYKFKLDGVDKDWSSPTRQTSASYINLPSGKYTFFVTAKTESSDWNNGNLASFSFTIQKAYYEKIWFWSIMLSVLGGLTFAIYWNRKEEREQQLEKERIQNEAEKLRLEHQALYAMMNPHFTFNALQSIQYFIHKQDKVTANKFLSSFAKLVRQNLESTKNDFISVAEEIERLNLYLSLEKMRFPEKFTYRIELAEGLEAHDILLPPMILQPFVENSIKHGIMPLEGEGEIVISLTRKDPAYLDIWISDNGVGLEASRKQQENRPKDHVSRGMQITMDRLALFSRMTGKKHNVLIREIVDTKGEVKGTEVHMVLPIHMSA